MRFSPSVLVVGIAALAAVASASDFKAPKLVPAPRTEAHAADVRRGTALHDQGDYDGAIAVYEKVLTESPDDVVALYELAYTLLAKKEYQKALEVSMRGAQYRSESLASFYVLIGTALDEMGKPDDAIRAYKAGSKLAPEDAILPFNLAVTYLNQKRPDDARACLKAAVRLRPAYASAHYLLATTLFDAGYRVPALFAAARFLTLEPDSDRANVGLRVFDEVLGGGFTKDPEPNHYSISVDFDGKKDEGDFDALNMVLGLTRAVGVTEENRDKPEARRLVEQVDSVLASVSELGPGKNKSTFTYTYYVPYFLELKKRGFVEPFVYYAYQQSSTPGVGVWLRDNEAKVNEFLAWSKAYAWPRVSGK